MSLSDRVKNILMQPPQEWQVIARERTSIPALYLSYVAPLAAIGPVASIIGLSVIGYGSPIAGRYRVAFGSSLTYAIGMYISSLIAVAVLALIVEQLTPHFMGWQDQVQAFKLVAYSSTAAWVAGIFRVVPALDVLAILGLYSLYLFYLGVPVIMKVPHRNVLGYTATVIVAAFVVFFVIRLIVSTVFPYPIAQ